VDAGGSRLCCEHLDNDRLEVDKPSALQLFDGNDEMETSDSHMAFLLGNIVFHLPISRTAYDTTR